ncbi:MAG: ABC transporter substrate-binding protein [Fimbriimonadaceae bacterium]|nr:ABC transporter substrate-binding protein [Fimbriimonadaceae bacterium]
MTSKTSSKISLLAALAAAAVLFGCKPAETGTAGGGGSGSGSGSGETKSARAMPTVEGPKVEGDTIKLGLVASLNGASKPWGEDCKSGAQLAVDEANAAGGINGKKIELMIEDSNSQPQDGRVATQKLVSEGALCVLGEVASGITRPMTDVTYAAGVPQVAIGATAVDLTQKYANIFRVCYNDDFQGPVMAKFAYDELKLRNVAVMTDNKLPYSQGLSASFKAAFEKLGGKIASEEFYEQGNAQFTGQITNLKSKNPDGIFLSGYFNEVGPIAKQLRQNSVNVPLFGGDGWDSTELINSGGDAIVGGYFCNHYTSTEDRPEVKDFLAKWKAKYGGEPGTTMGALTFDAANLVIQALKNCKELTAKELIAQIDQTENFKGVTGTITLKGQNGDPLKSALVVKVTRTGFDFAKSYSPEELK